MRAREERSCTDSSNAWLPAHVRKIEAQPVAKMDFASATMKKRRLDENIDPSPKLSARKPAPPPTKDEWSAFFGVVTASGLRPAVLSTNSKYSSLYMPAVRTCNGADLRLLYDQRAVKLNYDELMEQCEKTFSGLVINEAAVHSIEQRTRNQVNAKPHPHEEQKQLLKLREDISGRISCTFDDIFGPDGKQIDVYRAVMEPTIAEVMMGYNCTVFAYGQTGSGKTYTMEGERSDVNLCWADDPSAGIIPRTLQQLFKELQSQDLKFTIKVSFLELYNEELFDLLSALEGTSRLNIFEDSSRKGSVIIQGLKEITVRNHDEVLLMLQKGAAKRQTAATLLHATSSRSHSVFSITIHTCEKTDSGEKLIKSAKLNLVDLAGSENIGRSGAIDMRAREAASINQSLLALGRVITALGDKAPHIPYRESKLTRILQDSLGGRTKTSIIATISPDKTNLEETLSTLEYAHRFQNISNRPEANKKMTERALMKVYVDEIERLGKDLNAARAKDGVLLEQAHHSKMVQRLANQSDYILEKKAQIEFLNAKLLTVTELFERSKHQVAEATEQLQTTTAELHSTKRTLQAKEHVLFKTSIEKEEQAYLVQHHHKTEAALTATARELAGVAQATIKDIDLLQQKLQCTSAIDQTNKERQYAFVTSSSVLFDQIGSSVSTQLASQRETLTGIGGSFASLSSLIQAHQAAVAAYTLEARKFADESAQANSSIVSSLLSAVMASQEQQADQMAAALTSNQARLQKLCQPLVVERMQAAQNKLQELEKHRLTLGEQVASMCRLVWDEVSAHRNRQVLLITSIVEENDKLHRQLAASNEEIRRLSAAMETTSTEAEKNMAAFIQQFFTSQARNNDIIAKCDEQISALFARVEEASTVHASAIESNAELLVKSSGGLVSSVAAVHQDGAKAASDCLARAEEAARNLSDIHKVVEESISDEVASTSAILAEQARAAVDRMVKCTSGITEAVATATDTAQGQADRAKAMAGDLVEITESHSCCQLLSECQCGTVQTAHAQDISEALCAGIANNMAICSSVVTDFFQNDLQEYVPTGCTPQRQEYRYPTELAQTSPHERILNRLRTATDSNTATSLVLPTSDEVIAFMYVCSSHDIGHHILLCIIADAFVRSTILLSYQLKG
ncbi:kinesin-like protein KIF11 [Dermacentor silvarum]|uniref:kinesin-like protein KIF11 n=1 Tax=Dermacentor silvarum TaxID=543639 RepID=UPI00210145DD|nr:kinesin-like protein KIF11 [Dermacentor silvarum]